MPNGCHIPGNKVRKGEDGIKGFREDGQSMTRTISSHNEWEFQCIMKQMRTVQMLTLSLSCFIDLCDLLPSSDPPSFLS